MARVKVEEQDYADNPDEGFPEIVPENVDTSTTGTTKSPFLFSYFQQQQDKDERSKGNYPSTEHSARVGFANVTQIALHNSSTSSHYNRLKQSYSHLNLQNMGNGGPRGSTTSTDALNDTMHFVKGKGVLASHKDLALSPIGGSYPFSVIVTMVVVFFSFTCLIFFSFSFSRSLCSFTSLKSLPKDVNFCKQQHWATLHHLKSTLKRTPKTSILGM